MSSIVIAPTRAVALCVLATTLMYASALPNAHARNDKSLDDELSAVLANHHFTGTIETQFRQKLGRPIDEVRSDLGRMLWFDIALGLNGDNSCGGCHSPTNRFGDTQDAIYSSHRPDRIERKLPQGKLSARRHS